MSLKVVENKELKKMQKLREKYSLTFKCL